MGKRFVLVALMALAGAPAHAADTTDAIVGTWRGSSLCTDREEIETPRVHAVWRLTVNGKKMEGVMTLIPSKATVRRTDLTRDE